MYKLRVFIECIKYNYGQNDENLFLYTTEHIKHWRRMADIFTFNILKMIRTLLLFIVFPSFYYKTSPLIIKWHKEKLVTDKWIAGEIVLNEDDLKMEIIKRILLAY